MGNAVLAGAQAAERLEKGEIHFWYTWLDRPRGVAEGLRPLLAPDEAERAGRFRFERHQLRYVVGRGALRLLLERYTGCPAAELRFAYSEHGKPALAGPQAGVAFNVSHSENLAVFAVCLDEIGIDVERMAPTAASDRVPEQFFSPAEVRTLRALPAEEQPAGFLRCWTRKEAFLKARGDGLTLELDSFDVTLAPGDPPRVLRIAWAPSEAAEWSLHDLSELVPGHVCAVAIRGQGSRLAAKGEISP